MSEMIDGDREIECSADRRNCPTLSLLDINGCGDDDENLNDHDHDHQLYYHHDRHYYKENEQ